MKNMNSHRTIVHYWHSGLLSVLRTCKLAFGVVDWPVWFGNLEHGILLLCIIQTVTTTALTINYATYSCLHFKIIYDGPTRNHYAHNTLTKVLLSYHYPDAETRRFDSTVEQTSDYFIQVARPCSTADPIFLADCVERNLSGYDGADVAGLFRRVGTHDVRVMTKGYTVSWVHIKGRAVGAVVTVTLMEKIKTIFFLMNRHQHEHSSGYHLKHWKCRGRAVSKEQTLVFLFSRVWVRVPVVTLVVL